jgi:hypothetical protein
MGFAVHPGILEPSVFNSHLPRNESQKRKPPANYGLLFPLETFHAGKRKEGALNTAAE